jgi:hypothetical protein
VVEDLAVIAPWFFAVVPLLAMVQSLLRAIFGSEMSADLEDLVLPLEMGESCFVIKVVS